MDEKKAPGVERKDVDNAVILMRLQAVLHAREKLIKELKEIGYSEELIERYSALDAAFIDCIKQEAQELKP